MSALLAVLLGDFSHGFNNKIRNRTGLPWAGVWGPGEWAEPSAGEKERGAALPCPWAVGTDRAMAAPGSRDYEHRSATGLAAKDEEKGCQCICLAMKMGTLKSITNSWIS